MFKDFMIYKLNILWISNLLNSKYSSCIYNTYFETRITMKWSSLSFKILLTQFKFLHGLYVHYRLHKLFDNQIFISLTKLVVNNPVWTVNCIFLQRNTD